MEAAKAVFIHFDFITPPPRWQDSSKKVYITLM